MKPGDVLLVQGHSWFDRLIQMAQLRRDGKQARWSHAAMIVSADGDLIEAAGSHGVQRNHLSAYAAFPTVILSIDATDTQRASAVAFAESCIGDRYDWLDLGPIGLNLLLNDPVIFRVQHRYICSALYATGFDQAGYRWPRDPSDISPGDLAVLLETTDGDHGSLASHGQFTKQRR